MLVDISKRQLYVEYCFSVNYPAVTLTTEEMGLTVEARAQW